MEKEEPPIVIDAHVDETKVEDLGILLETPAMEHEGSVVETPVVVNDKDGIFKEKTTRILTRSLLKVPADDNSAGGNVLVPTTSGGSLVGSDEMKGGANVDDGSSSLTPSKKELKMSKKIALNKLPTNVRDLLGMGLLEGLLVKYVVYVGISNMVLKVWSRAMVYCVHALYARDVESFWVVSAYNFEIHAGSTKKHPSDYIFLESGKSLRDVLRACTSAPLDMLGSVIQNEIGEAPPNMPSTCQKCKELFHTSCIGKFALLSTHVLNQSNTNHFNRLLAVPGEFKETAEKSVTSDLKCSLFSGSADFSRKFLNSVDCWEDFWIGRSFCG